MCSLGEKLLLRTLLTRCLVIEGRQVCEVAVAIKNSCVGLGIMNQPLAEPRAVKAKTSHGSQVRVGLNRNKAKAN